MIILALLVSLFLALRLAIALCNLVMPVHLRRAGEIPVDEVSVLIPVRNEEENIGHLLEDLRQVAPGLREILVYDDGSTDRSPEILAALAQEIPALRILEGQALPAGWLGKNHACHQLALAASGSWLLFLDADVRITPSFVADLLRRAGQYRLDLLSVFPVQHMRTFGEWLSVPLMNWVLLSLLPLTLTRLSRRPSLSAANGQVMLFRAAAYERYHELVRTDAVEDIRIMQVMKARGRRTETVLSAGQVSCRMYRSFDEASRGFARNIHWFFGRSYLLMAIFALITTLGPLAIWTSFGPQALAAYLAGALLLRFLTALASRQPAGLLLLLHPLVHAGMLLIMWRAWQARRKGRLQWKGRSINKKTDEG